jgi:hypothetical protein
MVMAMQVHDLWAGGVRGFATTVLSVGGAALVCIAAVVLAVALFRAWRDRRNTVVVVGTLVDAACDPPRDGMAVGVAHRLREGLIETLPQLATEWQKIVEAAHSDPASPIRMGIKEGDDQLAVQLIGDIDASQRQLTESIEALAPDSARTALHVLSQAVLRPRGIRVSGVLQRTTYATGGVGVSFTVGDIQGGDTARYITLWEDDTGGGEGTQADAHDVPRRVHALVVPAARALACELLRQQLMTRTADRWTGRRLRHLTGGGRPTGESAAKLAKRRDAVIEFATGLVYQGAAHTCTPATVSFYQLSERALAKAAGELDYFRASFLLGVSLAELGKREEGPEQAASLLEEANRSLGAARKKLPRAGLPEADTRAEDLKIRAAIATNRCWIARRLPDEFEQAEKAAEAIAELRTVDPALLATSGLMYKLACPLAVAAGTVTLAQYGLALAECLTDAKRSLLHAALQNPGWWRDATADVDLSSLHHWMPRARRLLRDQRTGHGTAALAPTTARQAVDAVLTATARQPGVPVTTM